MSVQSLKKNREGETKGTYTGSDAAGQLESERKNVYERLDMKSCERGTLFHKCCAAWLRDKVFRRSNALKF